MSGPRPGTWLALHNQWLLLSRFTTLNRPYCAAAQFLGTGADVGRQQVLIIDWNLSSHLDEVLRLELLCRPLLVPREKPGFAFTELREAAHSSHSSLWPHPPGDAFGASFGCSWGKGRCEVMPGEEHDLRCPVKPCCVEDTPSGPC